MARSIGQLKAGFLRECHSEIRGASGMADALRKRIDCMKLEELLKSYLVRLTTDGESTNFGRHAGLWVKIADYFGRSSPVVWCVAHRSDLAFENTESGLPEFVHWLSYIKGHSYNITGSQMTISTSLHLRTCVVVQNGSYRNRTHNLSILFITIVLQQQMNVRRLFICHSQFPTNRVRFLCV